jgi:regulator of protease activity HflC (stomatin/prohibitin superfamily)
MSSEMNQGHDAMNTPTNQLAHPTAVVLKPLARVIAAIVILIVGVVLLAGFKSVQEDEGCLLVRNGEISESWGAGLHWRFTPISSVSCYRLSRSTYEASPGKAGSGAQYNDDPVEARTSDGQGIDALSFRISFRVPKVMPNSDLTGIADQNLRMIYTTVGARNTDELVSTVITFYARPEVRRVMQLHTSDELLYGDLDPINQEIETALQPIYAAHGIVIEDVLISKPDFNDAFEQRLQQGKQAETDIEIERQRKIQADQQNEARVNAANADATVAAIQQQTAGEQAISQANVNATVVSVQAQAEGDRTVTQANAEATAIAVQVAAYGSQDGYLQAQQIDAMRDWPVQVLGDSDTVPFVELSPPSSTATP